MRKDKIKKISKVTEVLLKNPLATTRQIEEETGISKSSVANYIQEDLDKLGQKDDRIIQLTDKDFELMHIIQNEKFARLTNPEDKVNDSDLDKWENTAVRRYSLFRGNATDDQGGLKEVIIEI